MKSILNFDRGTHRLVLAVRGNMAPEISVGVLAPDATGADQLVAHASCRLGEVSIIDNVSRTRICPSPKTLWVGRTSFELQEGEAEQVYSLMDQVRTAMKPAQSAFATLEA